jgi:2-keto-4-pentenoate hydratase/2-oxohepta-3-ene-1,7-dioic acid hydratase in catechol pathway
MKLVRFTVGSNPPQWGELEGETVYALTFSSLRRTGLSWSRTSVKLLVPAEPTKIVCVGRNYVAHAQELGNDVPTEPGLFLKGPNTLTVSGDTVNYPSWSENFNFEGELGLVIKKRASKVTREDALKHVLGYTCALDLTARDRQKTDLQWFRAKASDKFLPLGPWLETKLDPADVRVQTRVNGETRQDGRTSLMIFSVPVILEYITQFVTLEAGDVIITGTPEGVGPLAPGDHVEVEVEGIGVLETKIGPKVVWSV